MKDKIVIFVLVGALIGLIGVKQFSISRQVGQLTQQQEAQILAVETAELYRANRDLREDIDQLLNQKNQLANPSTSESQAALQAAVTQLDTVIGHKPIVGPGVKLQFLQSIQVTDIVDLVNALRNIGAEGLAINGQRAITSTGFGEPGQITVEAIGPPDILYNALSRSGGILSQINIPYNLAKEAGIVLPSAP